MKFTTNSYKHKPQGYLNEQLQLSVYCTVSQTAVLYIPRHNVTHYLALFSLKQLFIKLYKQKYYNKHTNKEFKCDL